MMKILIIEDDQLVANIYRNKFAHEGFQAETAPNGDVGLELVGSFRPDVVTLSRRITTGPLRLNVRLNAISSAA